MSRLIEIALCQPSQSIYRIVSAFSCMMLRHGLCTTALLFVAFQLHQCVVAEQEHFPRVYDDLGKPAVVSAAVELTLKGQLNAESGELPREAVQALTRLTAAFATDAAAAATTALQVQNAGYSTAATFVDVIGAPCYAILQLLQTGSNGSVPAACSSFFGLPVVTDSPSAFPSECAHVVADLSLPQYAAASGVPPLAAFATQAAARAAATRLQTVCGVSQLSVTAAAGFGEAAGGGQRDADKQHHHQRHAGTDGGRRLLLDSPASIIVVLGASISVVGHSAALTAAAVTAAVQAALQPARVSAAAFAAVLPRLLAAADTINAAAASTGISTSSITVAVPDINAPGGSASSLADVGGSIGFAESPADGSPWAPVVLQQAYSSQPASARQPASPSSDGGSGLSPGALVGAVAAAVVGIAAVGAISWRALVLARQRSQARARSGSSSSSGSATAESSMLGASDAVQVQAVPVPISASSARISRSNSNASGASGESGGAPLSARRAKGAASFLAADNAALSARGLLLGVSGGSAESEAGGFTHSRRRDEDPTGDAVHDN